MMKDIKELTLKTLDAMAEDGLQVHNITYESGNTGVELDEPALDEFATRLIAAYCEGQEPVAWRTHHDEPMLFPTINEAWQYCEDDEGPEPLFAAPVKNAKLDRKWIEASQRIATLEQRVAELENVISEHGADMWAQGEEYAVLSAKCAKAQIKADALEQQNAELVAALEKIAAMDYRKSAVNLFGRIAHEIVNVALSKVKQP